VIEIISSTRESHAKAGGRIVLQAADGDAGEHGAAHLVVGAVGALAAIGAAGRHGGAHPLPGDRHDDLARHGGDGIGDAAARPVHRAVGLPGLLLRRAEERVVPLAEVLFRRGGEGAAVHERRAERVGRVRHIGMRDLAVGVHPVDHVLQQHDGLRPLVRLDLGELHLRLQAGGAEQADRQDEDGDQHLEHRDPGAAAGEP
jgi:hypothetical protein